MMWDYFRLEESRETKTLNAVPDPWPWIKNKSQKILAVLVKVGTFDFDFIVSSNIAFKREQTREFVFR